MDSMVIVKVKFEPMDPNGEEQFKFESTVVGESTFLGIHPSCW